LRVVTRKTASTPRRPWRTVVVALVVASLGATALAIFGAGTRLIAPDTGLDTEAVIRTYPQAEQPRDLRIEVARRVGRPDLALSAADASTRLWPFNARTWAIVADLAEQRGQSERARQARERVRARSPSTRAAPR
jgi:hypothetical protein